MEYLESPYTAEEAQDYLDRGYKKWGKYYISPEEYAEREQRQLEIDEDYAGKGMLLLLGAAAVVGLAVTGVVKGVKWLANRE